MIAAHKHSRDAKIALIFLFLVMMTNYLDRSLFGVLQESIKADLKLTDFQLGLLGGPTFAILYTIMALPIGRLADRGHRVRLIVAVLSFWSVMTALCGMAASFVQILGARLGVSVGESGCAPVSHSILADRFPPGRRAGALSILTSGGNVGFLVSAFAGGALAHAYGWRVTFIICGLIGILLAIIMMLFLKEPARTAARGEKPSFRAALGEFGRKPAFVHLCLGMGLASLSCNAIMQYMTSFLIRVHNLPLSQAAMVTGVIAGGVGFATTILTGVIIDRSRERLPRIGLQLPIVGTTIGAAAYFVAFTSASAAISIAALAVAVFLSMSYLGAGWSTAQDIAPPHLRATATALLTLSIGLFGVAIGSPLLGFVSDTVAASMLAGSGLTPHSCGGLMDNAFCVAAQAEGIRMGMIAIVLPLFWSALHFWLGSRTLTEDMPPPAP